MILLGRTVNPLRDSAAAAHPGRLQYEAAVLSFRDVRFAGGGSIMAHRVYVDSTDDFIMWRAIDAIKPGSTPRVLVVDDYPVGADALQLLLEQNGFEARTVSDARLACAVAEEWLPFAIVVDVVMPGMTGFELARRLRERELTREMLLVAFTARASQADRARSLEAGFDVHCAKPLTPSRLLTVLGAIIGR